MPDVQQIVLSDVPYFESHEHARVDIAIGSDAAVVPSCATPTDELEQLSIFAHEFDAIKSRRHVSSHRCLKLGRASVPLKIVIPGSNLKL